MIYKSFINKRQEKKLEEARQRVHDEVVVVLEHVESDLVSMTELYTKFRKDKITRYDNLLNLCIYSSTTYGDITLLTSKVILTKQKMEKIIYARLLSMAIYEFLNTINRLIGNKLVKELEHPRYSDLIPQLKVLSKQYSEIKKAHHKELHHLRNNVGAHVYAEYGIDLSTMILGIDTKQLSDIGTEIIGLQKDLIGFTNIIFKRIVDSKSF